MARRRSAYGPGGGMSRYERLAGWCYLPFYLFLLSFLLQWGLGLLGFTLTTVQLNLSYYLINFAAILLIFHNYLLGSFRNVRFWDYLQSAILGFVFYYALAFVVSLAIVRLAPDFVNPNNEAVNTLADLSGAPMILCILILGPLVEEVLMRGLIFGTLHRHSRAAAYIVSILVFSAIHIWQFALTMSLPNLLLCAVQYVPGGIALAWCYEKSGSIWTNITVHCLINAVSLGVLSLI